MNLTTVQRIEKGLDRDGLMKLNNDLDKATNDYRGLIYIEAKEDCSYTSMSWEKYLDGFIVEGKQISKDYADRLIRTAKAREDEKKLPSENFKRVLGTLSKTLGETEAHIMLPESERTCQSLRGDNAKQMLDNWNDVRDATGEDVPTSTQVRDFNQKKNEASEKINEFAKKNTVPKPLPKPDPFTFEEELDFESWCVQEHNFDIVENKPKNTRAIYALKDENVTNLFGRLDEWKPAYKIMAKLCHPDTGGNSLAMSFLSDFKELMTALNGVKTVIDYEKKVEELRVEYSTPKLK